MYDFACQNALPSSEEAFQDSAGLEFVDVFGSRDGGGAAVDEEAGLDVLVYAGVVRLALVTNRMRWSETASVEGWIVDLRRRKTRARPHPDLGKGRWRRTADRGGPERTRLRPGHPRPPPWPAC